VAETLHIRVCDTGEERTIVDAEPLESATLFWQISDAIWQQKPEANVDSFHSVNSALTPNEARDTLNKVFSDIDKELVVSGAKKTLNLRGLSDADFITLTPKILNSPLDTRVGTFNWDWLAVVRQADIDGKHQTIAFTDGHTDCFRELNASFSFLAEKARVRLTYSMQRLQETQNHPTALAMTIWHSGFAESGYEGSHLAVVDLDTNQELSVLRAFQAIGGVALNGSKA